MRSAEEIKLEIINTFGFFPPFFDPAMTTPAVLENLWQQTLNAYVKNPIPDQFKEKLAALLSRYCTVPYCLMCHSSSLRPLGLKASEVLELLEMPAIGFEELARNVECINTDRMDTWPLPGSKMEECILHCCVAIFLNQDTEKCHETLRSVLPVSFYDFLILFLAYNRTALSWAEAHPELSHEADQRVIKNFGNLIEEEPKLADFFKNYRSKINEQTDRRTYWLSVQNKNLLDGERLLRSKLEEESALREKFVEALTHDLRTPITAVKLFAQMIEKKPHDAILVSTAVKKIIKNIDRTDSMIRDLLDSNRLIAGENTHIKFEKIDLKQLLESIQTELIHLHGDCFQLITEPIPVICNWDSLAIQRAIENLATNAIKYGKEQTIITISAKRILNHIEISVHNLGPPIPQNEQKNLFNMYHRSNEAQLGDKKGWGIGLSIVQGMMKAHKGDVTLTSDTETGTTFTLKIPIDA